ncbi:MAG: hypothetical protein RR588_09010 [Solibacillus sp.]
MLRILSAYTIIEVYIVQTAMHIVAEVSVGIQVWFVQAIIVEVGKVNTSQHSILPRHYSIQIA